VQADITKRLEGGIVEALCGLKIANADRDVVKHFFSPIVL
jgi:hypothetical protein